MLVAKTLFGVHNKIQQAQDTLIKYQILAPEGYILKFSGGKDSLVLYHLAKEAGVKFTPVFDLTTLDPPEVIRFVRDNYPDVIINRPQTTVWRLIVKKRMPPTRFRRFCCDVFKERPGTLFPGKLILTGVRWAESPRRKKRKVLETCQAYKGKSFLHPIIDWEEEDVWEYIHLKGLEYCSLYDEGWKRIGCIGCPMSSIEIRERELARYPKYKQAFLKTFERMLQAIKEHKGSNFEPPTQWKTPEDVYEWWLYGSEKIAQTLPQNELFVGDYYEQFELPNGLTN